MILVWNYIKNKFRSNFDGFIPKKKTYVFVHIIREDLAVNGPSK